MVAFFLHVESQTRNGKFRLRFFRRRCFGADGWSIYISCVRLIVSV